MNKLIYSFILLFAALNSCIPRTSTEKPVHPSMTLWYDKPAGVWTEALPLGNGRLAAMVYGKTHEETIQFNEETLWTGQPHDYAREGAWEYLDDLRNLLWEGKQEEAHELGNTNFMSQPFGQLSYQPFGNILLRFPGHEQVTAYQRRLDIEDAISSVTYELGGVKYTREVFCSSPGEAIVIRLEASRRGALNFTAGLDCPHTSHAVRVDNGQVILQGKANNYHMEKGRDGNPYPESKLTFEARLKVIIYGGEMAQNSTSIDVKNASSATLILSGATSFFNYSDISADPSQSCVSYLNQLEGKNYSDLRKEHVQDFKSLMNRVSLDLGSTKKSLRPTNERLASFKEDEDPAFVAMLFQFGRYLLISSSRKGTQPANLQGIWNDRLAPPWDSKYTININTEMNYWPVEMTNLAECADPLIEMVKDLSETGRRVAKEHYNLDGWVTHHNTDLWRGAAPINHANHGIWPTGGAWLCQHLWWHYQYNGDREYLRNTAYPILKEASRFFAGYLVPWPKNPEWLVSGPSNSPELGGLVMGPAMDHQIIRSLFESTIEAAEILGVDNDFAAMIREKHDSIVPNQIGQYGQLQEWIEDKDDPANKHRHVSHLWGLHPGSEIHPLTTPELAEASKVTLSHRGDGGTGWSRAWKINFWARLLDGNHAFQLLKNLMVLTEGDEKEWEKGGLYINLFDACPPFQIDGNFGATSGITEMLLQSHLRNDNGDFFQDILPALPEKLPSGKITGLKGRGGFELDIAWENGQLSTVKVKSLLGQKLHIRHKGKIISTNTHKDEEYKFIASDFL